MELSGYKNVFARKRSYIDKVYWILFGVLIIVAIFFAPAWLARQNKKEKPAMHYVRFASWVFGWSIIGWLWSLFCATKK
jgi:hypothetical protein